MYTRRLSFMELKVIRLANGYIFWWYRNISDVYVSILPTISKCKRIPRFFWEWWRMRKQSIPGHLSTSMRPGYEANPIGYSQLIVRSYLYWKLTAWSVVKSYRKVGHHHWWSILCVCPFIHPQLFVLSESVDLYYISICLWLLISPCVHQTLDLLSSKILVVCAFDCHFMKYLFECFLCTVSTEVCTLHIPIVTWLAQW